MPLVPITCPHCSQTTRVDMERSLTGQSCSKCGQFLYSADIGNRPEQEIRENRRKRWHSLTNTAMTELQTADVDMTDGLRRKGWQVWHMPMFMMMVALAIGVVVMLVRRARIERGLEKDPDQVVQISLQNKEGNFDAELIKSLAEQTTSVAPSDAWADEARELSDKFFNAASAAEIIPLVRNPNQVSPGINSFAAIPDNLPIAKFKEFLILYVAEENVPIGERAMVFFQTKEDRFRNVYIIKTPEGLKIDWLSYSGESEMDLQEFLKIKPVEPVLLRVLAHRDDYYNYDFQNRDLIACLRLVNWDESITFYGYPALNSRSAALLPLIPEIDYSIPYVARVRPRPIAIKTRFKPGSASPNQVEITEIVGHGWYVP